MVIKFTRAIKLTGWRGEEEVSLDALPGDRIEAEEVVIDVESEDNEYCYIGVSRDVYYERVPDDAFEVEV